MSSMILRLICMGWEQFFQNQIAIAMKKRGWRVVLCLKTGDIVFYRGLKSPELDF